MPTLNCNIYNASIGEFEVVSQKVKLLKQDLVPDLTFFIRKDSLSHYKWYYVVEQQTGASLTRGTAQTLQAAYDEFAEVVKRKGADEVKKVVASFIEKYGKAN